MGQRFTDPLGFNVLMTYLKLKYNEMINLRIIIRTVEFGIPLEIANRELILV
jgi:vacuolar-type H+-ATPase subunit C/Vma6